MNKINRFGVRIECLHEMTGSCILVSACYPNGKSENFTVDCGMFQEGNKKLNESFPVDPKDYLFSINTHVHDDHIGKYPLFVKHGFKGRIYTTTTSAKLASFILPNNSRILEKNTSLVEPEPLYTREDAEKALKQFIGFPYRRIIKPTKNISFILYENGHIPGACMILVVISYPGEKDIRLLFTGDYLPNNTFFNVPSLPNEVFDNYISGIIHESTYGRTNSFDYNEESDFISIINNAIRLQKTVVIPSFALGRTQECLYRLSIAQQQKVLDASLPIYMVGPTAKVFNNMFRYEDLGLNSSRSSFIPKSAKYVNALSERIDIINDKMAKVIVGPGGFSDYGSITHYIENAIGREDCLILYPGYTSETSAGGRLRSTKKGESIAYLGKNHVKHCDVQYIRSFSAHAKKDELFNLFNNFSHVGAFFPNHGEEEIKASLGEDISIAFPKSQVGILDPVHSYLIGASGIIEENIISHYL